jgi:hypothetical protein
MISNVALVLGVIVGPVLLGVLLYYGIKATEKRDNSPAAAREITERGTERLYNAENEDFARSEEASRIHKFQRRHAKNHN